MKQLSLMSLHILLAVSMVPVVRAQRAGLVLREAQLALHEAVHALVDAGVGGRAGIVQRVVQVEQPDAAGARRVQCERILVP